MRITQLTEEDWQKYRDITLEATLKEPQAFISLHANHLKYDEAKWRSRLAPFAPNSQSVTLFAVNDNDEVVGKIVILLFKEDEVEIAGVYVRDSERGKGLGRMLMEEAIKISNSVKANRDIVIEVNSIQESAKALYSKMGFREISRSNMIHGDGKEYEVIKMKLQE